MEYSHIIYEPGKVTRIKMNRPRYLNALSHPHYLELEDAFDRAAEDEKCRVIVHSGEGRCFSTGHDMLSPEAKMMADGTTREQLAERLGSETAAQSRWWQENVYYTYEMKLRKWRVIPKPTIAMVHGYCIFGAFVSAASMDLVFASEDALFLPPLTEFNMEQWDWSLRKTKELLFEHRFLSGREAYECGFVSRIYSSYDVLERETLAYANRVAENDSYLPYIRNIKHAINNKMDISSFMATLDAAGRLSEQARHGPAEAGKRKVSKGVAQVPLALANLKAKQEAEKA